MTCSKKLLISPTVFLNPLTCGVLDGFSNGEGENSSFLPWLGGGGGGGGGGGEGGMPCPLLSKPPPPAAFSAVSHPFACLPFQNDEKRCWPLLGPQAPRSKRLLRNDACLGFLHHSFIASFLWGASVGSALLSREPWRVGATHYSFQDTDTPSAFVSSQAQPLQSKQDARLA